jgi:hypothetical protein
MKLYIKNGAVFLTLKNCGAGKDERSPYYNSVALSLCPLNKAKYRGIQNKL